MCKFIGGIDGNSQRSFSLLGKLVNYDLSVKYLSYIANTFINSPSGVKDRNVSNALMVEINFHMPGVVLDFCSPYMICRFLCRVNY